MLLFQDHLEVESRNNQNLASKHRRLVMYQCVNGNVAHLSGTVEAPFCVSCKGPLKWTAFTLDVLKKLETISLRTRHVRLGTHHYSRSKKETENPIDPKNH